MQRRVINKRLRQAFLAAQSKLPSDMKEEFYKSAYIAGSSISSLYLDEEPNDYDIYFRTQSFADKIKEHFKGVKVIFKSDSAITILVRDLPIQFIYKDGFIGEPDTRFAELPEFTPDLSCIDHAEVIPQPPGGSGP